MCLKWFCIMTDLKSLPIDIMLFVTVTVIPNVRSPSRSWRTRTDAPSDGEQLRASIPSADEWAG